MGHDFLKMPEAYHFADVLVSRLSSTDSTNNSISHRFSMSLTGSKNVSIAKLCSKPYELEVVVRRNCGVGDVGYQVKQYLILLTLDWFQVPGEGDATACRLARQT